MNEPSSYSSSAGEPSELSAEERADALARVRAPALWLIATGWISLVLQLATTVALIVWQEDLERMAGMPLMTNKAVTIAMAIPSLLMPVLMIVGAMKMRRLEGYGLAMVGAVVAWIPCTSPCCVLSIPIGIWAFVVLLDANVKQAFRG